MGETFKSAILTFHKNEAKPIEIVGWHEIYSVAFLGEGKHIVSGGKEGKIRRWRTEDGNEVETPMDARSQVSNIAVSRDGKWIVSGAVSGELTVWDSESHKEVVRWQGHSEVVVAVDISLDGTRIATGSGDFTACVWSLTTVQRLLGPLEHNANLIAAKFSPDGRLIATATWRSSVWVYDIQNGRILVDVPIEVANHRNQSLVWVSNSKYLFALSRDGKISYLGVSTGSTLFSWPIHSNIDNQPGCIALANNGTFIAASAGSSVSFWDTTTHKQIGSTINHTTEVMVMAISVNDDLAIGGGKVITLRNKRDMLPSSYHKDVSALA